MLVSHPSRLRRLSATLVVLVAAVGLGSVPAPAHAARTFAWTGVANELWSAPENWAPNGVPGAGDHLMFGPGRRTTTVSDLTGDPELGSISVGAGGYTIGGSSLRVAEIASLGDLAISAPLVAATTAVDAAAGATVALSGAVSSSHLVLKGNGRFRLTGTARGSVTVQGGSSLALDSGVAGSLTFASMGTLSARGTVLGAVSIGHGATLSPAGGDEAGLFATGGDVGLAASSTYRVDISSNGTSDLTRAGGAFGANGSTLDVRPGYTPAPGTRFVIASGGSPVVGRFADLPEGAVFTSSGVTFQISYADGDITLTVVDPPTATITVADTDLRAEETSLVTITFSEAVSGLGPEDLTVPNGTLSVPTSTDGITWHATLTPATGTRDATNVITLANSGVQNAAGTPGVGTTTSNNYAVRTRQLGARIDLSDTALKIGDSATVEITFTEPVADFTIADLTVTNGTVSDLRTSDDITWQATLRPAGAVDDATNVVSLDLTGVTTSAGEDGIGTVESDNYAVDTVRPDLVRDIELTDRSLGADETAEVTLTFNEPVTGLDAADLDVPNAGLGALSSADGGRSWTATLTPAADVVDATNVLTLDLTGINDRAGNAGVGTLVSGNYAVDTVRPTATISVWDDQLGANDVTVVVIEFDAAVTDLTDDDLDVPSATLGTLTSTDGGRTWSASLTPAPSTEDATNVITLDLTGVRGPSGNAGTGTATSDNYEVDTAGPTADLAVTDTDLRIGETSPLTITFSEAVVGFTTADLTVANGAVSDLASSDGGVTWTATLTPAAGVRDASNVVTLDTTGAADEMGNPGVGTATSNEYAVDTVIVVPDLTAPVSAADAPRLSATRTWTVTFTASDADSGIATVDLYVRGPGETAYRKVDTGTGLAGELRFTGTVDGTYDFHTVATDRAGNTEEAPAGPDATTVLDTIAPESQATGPRLVGSRTWSVGYTATDAGSGVDTVDLWVRAPGETAYTKVDTATDPEGELTYTAGVDGTHDFRTVATDRAGHVEADGDAPDVSTLVDTRAPSVTAVGATPWIIDLGGGALQMRFRVDEDADVSVRILQRRDPVRAYRTRSIAAGVLAVRWAGRDEGGARVQPGRYRALVVAEDAAGNRTRLSVPVRVRR